jgi:hypothetical protein
MDVWKRMKIRHEEDLNSLLEQLHEHIENGIFEMGLAESGSMRK